MTPPKTECDMADFPIEKGDCDKRKRKRRRLEHASFNVCPVTYKLVRKPHSQRGSVDTALAKRGLSRSTPPGGSLIKMIEKAGRIKAIHIPVEVIAIW
ncbi:hypothetical protein TWF506_011450 [Arthrobotrys conoides]|uniref:Uncharacterized protein n=1 Tax=Arthrobotrys conoides TaxID=74498 RepID=A0AAN8N675_9PEZI